MGRINIYLTDETKEKLAEYRKRVWGNHHSLSAIIQRAIREFLERESEDHDTGARKSS